MAKASTAFPRKVTITALPRKDYRGFGAIERYFITGEPEQLEVSETQYKELQADPACYFLKVEDGWKEPEAAPAPAAAPGAGRPTDPPAR